MIKIILFDIDNTLIDHTAAENKAISWIHDEYFKQSISLIDFHNMWLEKTKKNWRLFEQKKITFTEQQTQRIQDVWKSLGNKVDKKTARNIFDEYLSEYEKAWKTFKGVEDLLSSLENVGILSNGNLAQQLKKLQAANLLKFFDQKNIFTSEEIGIAKPDQKLFSYIKEKLKLKNNEILYVGDKLGYDIKPALKEGWNAIWIDHYNIFRNRNYEKVKNIKELKSLLEKYGNNLFCNNGINSPFINK